LRSLIHSSRPHRYLHSFPTRRSSDLVGFAPAPPAAGARPARQEAALLFCTKLANRLRVRAEGAGRARGHTAGDRSGVAGAVSRRSEEHTSELQSRFDLVCRLLLEKKK